MKYRFPEMFQLKKLVQAEIAGWSVAALGLLIWAGTTILRRSCLTISNAPSNSPLCQNPFNEPVALFVAFGFWIIAVLIWLASGHNLAPAFFMTIADVLALGIVANIGNTGDLATRFFYVLLAWLGPLCLHFQYVLLDRRGNRIEQSVIFVFYGLGIIASVLVLFSIPDLLENQGLFLYLRALIRLNLILALLVGSIFVLKGYRLSNSPVVRRRIRVVTFGTLFASSPLVLLSVLPDTLGSPAHIPYAITFPLLLLIPGEHGQKGRWQQPP